MYTANKNHFICLPVTVPKTFLCILFLATFFLPGIQAQKTQKNAPLARLITQVPFDTFTGGVVVIRAQLIGFPDTLNFIMDTGSGGISLDSTTCIRLNLQSVLTDKLIMGIGGVRRLRFVNNRSLKLGDMQIDSLNFHVSDYDILSTVYGDRIDGIIGYSFFTRYIVKFDYDSSQMYIYSKGQMKYPRGGFQIRPAFTSLPVQGGILRDSREVSSRFYFDTGAGLCILLNSDFIRDSSILSLEKKPLPTQAQGMGGKANMELTTMKEFRLGPYRFRNVPTYIFNDEYT